MTLRIMTLSIKSPFVTLSVNDAQHNNALLSDIMLSVIILNVVMSVVALLLA